MSHLTPGKYIAPTISVKYTGTDTLKAGYALCRDLDIIDDTQTGTGISGSSVTTAADQAGIAASQPSFSNIHRFLGVVAEGNSRTQLEATVARTIKIVPAWAMSFGVTLWTDENVPLGGLLGLKPASFAFSNGGVVTGQLWARAEEAQDRSTTAGTVAAEFGQIVVSPMERLTQLQEYHNDFLEFDSNEIAEAFVFTETGTGTEVLADAVGGELLLTNSAADDDAIFGQQKGEKWLLAAGKPLFFCARLKVSDDDQIDWVIGLCVTDTTPLAAQDNVYFRKDDGDTNVDFNTDKNATQNDTDTGLDAVASQYLILAFFWDGKSTVRAYGYTSATAANVKLTNLALLTSPITNINDDEEMTLTFGVQNGEAVAKTMNIDYITIRQKK